MLPRNHVCQARYLLNYYNDNHQWQEEYTDDVITALQDCQRHYTVLEEHDYDLRIGDLLSTTKRSFKKRLADWYSYHQSLHDSLKSLSSPDNMAQDEKIDKLMEMMKAMQTSMVTKKTIDDAIAEQVQPLQTTVANLTKQVGDMQTKINAKRVESLAKDLSGNRNSSSSQDLDLDTLAIKPSYFRPDDVGYFDPHKDTDGDMTTLGKEVWFTDVHLFVDRVRDVAKLKGENVVKTNLPSCLRGSALAWYSTELDNEDRQDLRDSDLHGFCIQHLVLFASTLFLQYIPYQRGR